MEAFGISELNPLLLAAAVASALALLFLILWMRCRGKATATGLDRLENELSRARKDLQDLEQDKARLRAAQENEIGQLRKRAEDAEDHAYLDDFSSGGSWTLVVSLPVSVNDRAMTLGLARDEAGESIPFLTEQAFAGVKNGDRFHAQGGRLLPVDSVKPVTSAAKPNHPSGDAEMTMFLRPGASRDPHEGLPFLKVQSGNDEGGKFFVGWGKTAMGRAAANQVTLDDDQCSRVHAEIVFDGKQFQLHDNHSTNGTRLNGETVSRSPLTFGDVIGIGGSDMLFTCDGMEQMRDAPQDAIAAFEGMLRKAPDYVDAVRQLAFLLERDLKRKGEADAMWKRLSVLEKQLR